MRRNVILDTSALVALLQKRDPYHQWAGNQLATIRPPLFTCEPVLTEACFLMSRTSNGVEAIFELMETDLVELAFELKNELASVRSLIDRYANVPMSLADACLVRMSELYDNSTIFTLDSDFHIYRKHGNQPIPLIIPA